jgi:hypothetical protein
VQYSIQHSDISLVILLTVLYCIAYNVQNSTIYQYTVTYHNTIQTNV